MMALRELRQWLKMTESICNGMIEIPCGWIKNNTRVCWNETNWSTWKKTNKAVNLRLLCKMKKLLLTILSVVLFANQASAESTVLSSKGAHSLCTTEATHWVDFCNGLIQGATQITQLCLVLLVFQQALLAPQWSLFILTFFNSQMPTKMTILHCKPQ